MTFLFLLAGCGDSGSAQTTDTEESTDETANESAQTTDTAEGTDETTKSSLQETVVPTEYEDALDDYKKLVTYLFSKERLEDLINNGEFNLPEAVTVREEQSEDWFYMAADARQGLYNASPESFGYALYDFDGDDTDELMLLREDCFVLAIYTIESGESKLLDAYSYKDRAILLESGLIYNRISDGAVDYQIRLLEVCDQKLVTTSEFGYKQESDRYYPYKIADGTVQEITVDEFDTLNADYKDIYEADSIKDTVAKLGIEFVSLADEYIKS